MRYVIDRFENGSAVLEDEKMNVVTVQRSLVDENAIEGAYVTYNGKKYVMDDTLVHTENSDRERIRNKFDKLKKR